MATRSMAYDHPTYTVNVAQSGVMTAKGAAGTQLTNVGFGAYADTLVRAVHFVPIAAGTNTAAANVGHLLAIHVRNGTGVTGGTSTLIAAGDYGTALTGTTVLHTATLSRGDFYRVLNTGTDAGAAFAITVEASLIPGASVTV
jgi:hypothetical protein